MNRARRRLTSVIEQISMSERRIPYVVIIYANLAKNQFRSIPSDCGMYMYTVPKATK